MNTFRIGRLKEQQRIQSGDTIFLDGAECEIFFITRKGSMMVTRLSDNVRLELRDIQWPADARIDDGPKGETSG